MAGFCGQAQLLGLLDLKGRNASEMLYSFRKPGSKGFSPDATQRDANSSFCESKVKSLSLTLTHTDTHTHTSAHVRTHQACLAVQTTLSKSCNPPARYVGELRRIWRMLFGLFIHVHPYSHHKISPGIGRCVAVQQQPFQASFGSSRCVMSEPD